MPVMFCYIVFRCNLLDEELKNVTLTYENVLEEFDAAQKKNSEEYESEINKVIMRLREYAAENENLKQKGDKVLKTAKKMKVSFKSKLTEMKEALNSIKQEKASVSFYFIYCLSLNRNYFRDLNTLNK